MVNWNFHFTTWAYSYVQGGLRLPKWRVVEEYKFLHQKFDKMKYDTTFNNTDVFCDKISHLLGFVGG